MYVSYSSVGNLAYPGGHLGQIVSECSVCHALVLDRGQYLHSMFHNKEEANGYILAARVTNLEPDDPFGGEEWSDL